MLRVQGAFAGLVVGCARATCRYRYILNSHRAAAGEVRLGIGVSVMEPFERDGEWRFDVFVFGVGGVVVCLGGMGWGRG